MTEHQYVYEFPEGAKPDALGGTVVRVIGQRVLLDVGPNPGLVDGLVAKTDGWRLVDLDGDSLSAAVPKALLEAIDATVDDGSARKRDALAAAVAKVRER